MAGTAQTSSLGFVAWEAEDSFADSADDTYTTRMTIRDDRIDVSGLARPLLDAGGVHQRFNEADFMRQGAYGIGTFTTTFDLYGHGSATTGSLTATALTNLLAHAVGNSDTSQVGGLLTTGTNDENTLTSTNVTGVTGGLIRVGAHGDTRADGQASVLSNASSPFGLDVDLPAAPTTADSVRAMQLVYPVSSLASGGIITSDGSSNNNTLRFVLATGNLQFVCRGCVCTDITIAVPLGGLPTITLTWSTVAWGPVSQTFPSAVLTGDYAPTPVTNGSLEIGAKGTSTRVTDVPLEWSVQIGQGIEALTGTNGENTYQSIVGWRRMNAQTTVSVTVESESRTATPSWWDYHRTDPNSQTAKRILMTCSTVDGSAIAMYFPNCKPMGSIPTQGDTTGLNTVTAQFLAATNTDTTNELTLSAWRLGMG